ncbi:glycosyltransferase involved in cell wall biosynthesis/GT2 family glycosyltransferase/SAM-dependent methyltransferase [Aminobacter ciceronei]|uniref:Glycosyltransferase involved in cell wall biosynthesis/GT2 family glycosyltransferase/SAM-dependent methyltransferase n=4 Tax=Aminobacter ciceronei TaxID=150723 RepID=A0ABR6CJ97_9HYPH|nr:glycosyltransferase involved in cell wall biosynthesis/GT2 family glycosyltransferase/SAM-dependent methyltransferase [Aminobacter ciceronei]
MSHYRTGWRVRSYEEIVSSEESRQPVAGTVFPGVMPSWDNSARRPANGEIIHGATPALFERWLSFAIARAHKNNNAGGRFVLINAWNEWAEGAYLEPDKRFGYAYLEACASAIRTHVDNAKFRLFAGDRIRHKGAKTILICSHHAGKQVFGGERSLLDVLRALADGGFNLAVTIQEGGNVAYVKELKKYAQEIYIFGYSQWTSNQKDTYAATPQFLDIIDVVKPDLVYVNTIVVASPLAAARLRGIPSVVHAREIILHDEDLQKQLGLTGEQAVRQVLESTEHIIANSQATAMCFAGGNVATIPNTIDLKDFDLPADKLSDIVTFGLISSNLPKKGVEDFIALARACAKRVPNARFLIIGPLSRPLITGYLSRKRQLPKNLSFTDYLPTSAEAIAQVDVVVNFSHFQESFGRTVLEGMAAKRPAIVYDWGALSELVSHGETGFLVRFGQPAEAVTHVEAFCRDRALLQDMGARARERAAGYDFPYYREKLVNFCREIIGKEATVRDYSQVRDERLECIANKTVDIVICVHNALRDVRACLASVMAHLGAGHRVILIDDGSGDETRGYLHNFARANNLLLHRNGVAQGYTRAANVGLSLSSADLVILLNSDTIVTSSWAEKLADAVFSTPGGGAVGPMSNAASFQSIPSTAGTDKQTAVNDLPPNTSPDEMNEWCERHSTSAVPSVPLIHGFCLGITRQALDTVGKFDESAFPHGYGEENDYCFRLAAAGFRMVVATHTYVYHVKSSSYTVGRRQALSEQAQQVLYGRYGEALFGSAIRALERSPELSVMRVLAENLYEEALAGMTTFSTTRRPLPHLLSGLDDAQWLQTLQASVDSRIVDGINYPGFPDASLQVETVGSSGKETIAEGFRFYSFVLNAARVNGIKLTPGSKVLDFGAGWGRIMRCFLREVLPSGLHGVDTSDRFLGAARQTGVPGTFNLIQPDGSLPFESNSLDIVYAYSVFSHLPEHIQKIWLTEIARVLKPGGLFVATVQPPRFLDFIRSAEKECVAKSAWLQELRAELTKIKNIDTALEESKFIFLPTNNGKTYGDTIMTSTYVGRVWGAHFDIKEYLDDAERFQQAIVTAQVRK